MGIFGKITGQVRMMGVKKVIVFYELDHVVLPTDIVLLADKMIKFKTSSSCSDQSDKCL